MSKSGSGFDLPARTKQRAEIEEKMSAPGFWDDPDGAQKVVAQLSAVKSIIDPVNKVTNSFGDLDELLEMAVEENDDETMESIAADVDDLNAKCDKIEIAGMLSGPDDMCACFFSIHAGAGGTESCDWAATFIQV